MPEAFVKSFKRDYFRVATIRDAHAALAMIESWIDDYNTVTHTPDWDIVHRESISSLT